MLDAELDGWCLPSALRARARRDALAVFIDPVGQDYLQHRAMDLRFVYGWPRAKCTIKEMTATTRRM